MGRFEELIGQAFERITPQEWRDNQDTSSIYKDIFENWKEQNGSLYDGFAPDAMEDDFCEEMIDDKVEDFWNDFSIEEEDGGVIVYRTLTVPDPDEYMFMLANGEYLSVSNKDFHGTGIYWSWDEDAAEAHWGKSGWKEITLKALVPLSSIDFDRTAMLNVGLSGYEEREVTLKKGSQVLLKGIELVDVDYGSFYKKRQWYDVDNAEGYIPLVARLEKYPTVARILKG
jgi:hypothetical protein